MARLAGKLDAEQQSRGIVVPLADLLIGATALSLRYSVLTVNARHFGRIPGLKETQDRLGSNANWTGPWSRDPYLCVTKLRPPCKHFGRHADFTCAP